jgi:hypothetical protein
VHTFRGVLDLIASQLGADAARSGFSLSDSDRPVQPGSLDGTLSDGETIQFLGFRRTCPGEPLLLLELSHVLAEQLVTGAVWRPDDLVVAGPRARIDAVARFYQVWHYGDSTAPQALARAVVKEIKGWLTALDRVGAAAALSPAGDRRRPRSASGMAEGRGTD